MKLQIKDWVATCLGISAISLIILVPGGPIETRSFSHINPLILGSFNTFLTTLGLGSLLLIYFVLKSERWAMGFSALCGLSYLGVYVLDLAHIFPLSPDAMPLALLTIEIFGSILSVPLMVVSIQALQGLRQPKLANASLNHADHFPLIQIPTIVITIALGMIGIGIIVFATYSAMGL